MTAAARGGTTLTAVSAIHFFVDLACIFLVTSSFPAENWLFYVVLYNFCAFALQLPLGVVCDRRSAPLFPAVCGCVLVALAYPLTAFLPIGGCLAAGLGNALFHIGGGVAVMRAFPKTASPLGIFVSPGALGVFFGVFCAREGLAVTYLFPLLLLVCAAVLAVVRKREGEGAFVPREDGGLSLSPGGFAAAGAALLFFAVVLRSWFGLIVTLPWKTGFLLPFLFVVGVAAGKVLGGLVGDRLGLRGGAVTTLALSALLFLFAEGSPAAGIAAICCYNMTMPLTLFALGEICGEAKGFAFGLTTFALFLGTLPTLLPLSPKTADPALLVPLVVLAAVLICGGVALARKGGGKGVS